jgi:imidazolonepropionase-like amidohydrolase
MSKVKMTAGDTLHSSKYGRMEAGQTYEIDESDADAFAARGYLTRSAGAPLNKAESAPENKAETAPAKRKRAAPADEAGVSITDVTRSPGEPSSAETTPDKGA